MTKIYITFLFSVSFSLCSIGQGSLQRTTISSLGSSSTLDGMIVRQTVGQPYGTNTNINNDFNYRPGFQQPMLRVINIRQTIEAKIYPNPTSEEVNIETSVAVFQANVSLYDAAGKILKSQDFQELKVCKIDCNNLPTGTYFIIVSDKKSELSTNKLIISH